ncbi:unnamed protein product [Phytomonas sp. Hart1]|nr:unnamed protein product [Phytomonas sp. Hart1]|eukprot:CCW72092.1 unnamed protein product [Phytomonas sp. isolate Hart1]
MDAGDLSGVIAGFHQHSLFLFLSATAVDGILQATAQRKGISGRFWAFASLALGFYAAGKLTLTVIHIAGSTFALQDLLTRVVDLLQWLRILTFPRRFYTSAGDSVAISSSGPHTPILQLLAWVVNVWMILSSVRGLLLIVFQLTMTFSSITADTTAVAFSGMMGVYFIGQLVILQQSPPQASLFAAADSVSAFADVGNAWPRSLGPLPINFYQRLNEWCFVLGFTLTFFVRRYVLGDLAATTVSVAHG